MFQISNPEKTVNTALLVVALLLAVGSSVAAYRASHSRTAWGRQHEAMLKSGESAMAKGDRPSNHYSYLDAEKLVRATRRQFIGRMVLSAVLLTIGVVLVVVAYR